MYYEIESVRAQRMRECRDRAYKWLIAAAIAVGVLALCMIFWSVSGAMQAKEPLRPITQEQLRRMQVVCSHVDNRDCMNARANMCRATINGRTVYSSESC